MRIELMLPACPALRIIELWKAGSRLLLLKMEREKGIEPSLPAWKAGVLPLNYSRNFRVSE